MAKVSQNIHEWISKMRAAHERADREEFARVRAMPQAERIAALKAACITAQKVLGAMEPEARARARNRRDPLPESSVRALRHLREKAQKHVQH